MSDYDTETCGKETDTMSAMSNNRRKFLLDGGFGLLIMLSVSGCIGGSHEKLGEGESLNARDMSVNMSYILNPYSIDVVNRIFLNDMAESAILDVLQVIMTQDDVAPIYQSFLPEVRNCIRHGLVHIICVSGDAFQVFVCTSSDQKAACYVVDVSKSTPLRMTSIGFGKIN